MVSLAWASSSSSCVTLEVLGMSELDEGPAIAPEADTSFLNSDTSLLSFSFSNLSLVPAFPDKFSNSCTGKQLSHFN